MPIHPVRIVKIAAACALLAAGSAQAQTAKDYNVFLFGDFTGINSDVEGRLAAGGNVSITNYGVGGSAQNGNDNLVAGGTLRMENGQLHHGNAVAGTLNISNAGFPGGSARADATGIDFAAEQARLLGISSSLSGEATNATVDWRAPSNQWDRGGYTLTGTQATGINIFNISADNLANANSLAIDAASDSFVLVNVDGAAAAFRNAGFLLSGGITADHILFNFSDATSLTLDGIGFEGTILAPNADVTFLNGQVNGSLIANSLTGGQWNTGEFHYRPYAGTLLDSPPPGVPEPAAWAMLIGGFGLAGAALRRSKRPARAFAHS